MSQDYEGPICPKCRGKMWDNRESKRNPKAPDYRCRDKSCDGVIWPPKGGQKAEPSNPFDEPEYAREQERHENETVAAIKKGDRDTDSLIALEARMSLCLQAAERLAAKHDAVVDPQALAVSFFIELNKQR